MSGKISYSAETFEKSLHAGFIDNSVESDARFAPRLIANNSVSATNVLSVIKSQLRDCDRFDFSVAFVAEGGLQALLEALNDLRARDIKGRFLTSTYLNFNKPSVLRKLLEYPNIETRVFQGSMHAKGYLFEHGELSTVIIGSSNLTQTALTCNREWNVLFRSFEGGDMLQRTREEYESLWNDEHTCALTDEWLLGYEKSFELAPEKKSSKPTGTYRWIDMEEDPRSQALPITPNKMQSHALEALGVLHEKEEPRALLVSATGTGKTYLSALDVAAAAPKRVLFIAHRRRILEASQRSFERVLGSRYTYMQYQSGADCSRATCVFAMCTGLSLHLDDFDPDEFDYIIIDEAHRTGARGYQKILNYFRPAFYLGMTATPSRTDGYDVFALFNHVIAFRISLQDALENDLLAPFHYFGIADLEIDDETIDDPALFARLTSDERVKHVIGKIEEYTIDKTARRGLIFCSRNNEASELATKFTERGYRSVAISGEDSDDVRNDAIRRLENDELDYIFSVDILNEGVDIPSLNQIIMLRRTESPIVFIQQLGRGLRKVPGKEFTLILDFIGNYQKNYFVPIALSGDRTYNKDNLRTFVKEGSTIVPGCSTVNFDQVSEKRIFRAIDGGKFTEMKLLKDEYRGLKQVLGRIPTLLDFDENQAIDPLNIIRKSGSYHAFLSKYEPDYKVCFTESQEEMLKYVSQSFGSGKRLDEIIVLQKLLQDFAPKSIQTREYADAPLRAKSVESVVAMLTCTFSSTKSPALAIVENGGMKLSAEFERALANEAFRMQVCELLDFASERYRRLYAQSYKNSAFTLYEKYTYEDVCKLLGWKKNINGQNIGGYKYDETTNTFPVFINYDKDPGISETIQYEDRFVSDSKLIALSKQPRYVTSPEILRLKEWPSNGMKTYLFMRKNKDDGAGGKEFYFLGEMYPTGTFVPVTMKGTSKKAVEITYRLETPVRQDIYDYLTCNFNEGEE